MLKNKKKFAITAALVTAPIVALGFEVDYTIQKLRNLKRDSIRYQTAYKTQRSLTEQMLADFEKVKDIDHLNNTTAFWKFIVKKPV